MRTAPDSVKAKNILRDPRVSFCVQEERPPYASVTIYGTATIEPEEPGLGLEMATRYLGFVGGRAYMRVAAEAIQAGEEVTIAITADRVLTQDFSSETPAVGRAWLKAKRVLPPWLLTKYPLRSGKSRLRYGPPLPVVGFHRQHFRPFRTLQVANRVQRHHRRDAAPPQLLHVRHDAIVIAAHHVLQAPADALQHEVLRVAVERLAQLERRVREPARLPDLPHERHHARPPLPAVRRGVPLPELRDRFVRVRKQQWLRDGDAEVVDVRPAR